MPRSFVSGIWKKIKDKYQPAAKCDRYCCGPVTGSGIEMLTAEGNVEIRNDKRDFVRRNNHENAARFYSSSPGRSF